MTRQSSFEFSRALSLFLVGKQTKFQNCIFWFLLKLCRTPLAAHFFILSSLPPLLWNYVPPVCKIGDDFFHEIKVAKRSLWISCVPFTILHEKHTEVKCKKSSLIITMKCKLFWLPNRGKKWPPLLVKKSYNNSDGTKVTPLDPLLVKNV